MTHVSADDSKGVRQVVDVMVACEQAGNHCDILMSEIESFATKPSCWSVARGICGGAARVPIAGPFGLKLGGN